VDDLARLLVQLDRSVAGGNERLDRLTKAFDEYEEDIAESNATALVSALSVVVRDFNSKINEQFGENFKQLNAAVARLVSWQAQYEQQLEASIAHEAAARESMTEATSRFTDVVNMTSEFAAVARSLQGVVDTLHSQSEQLARALMLLSGLIVEVEEGLPVIEKRIVQMIARTRQGVQREQEAQGAEPRRAGESLRATRA
jgi:chromosome segregation ATPase